MNPLLLMLLGIFFVSQVKSQNISGKVIDKTNALELWQVKIINKDHTFSVKTDINGNFSLPKAGTYTFSKKGYTSKSLYIKSQTKIIVKLVSIPENLNEIIITSNNFKSRLKSLPAAINVLSVKEINQNNSINIAPILNTVPGVFMHNGTLTTNRITIRGIGSRNLYGTSKIKAYYQDIPLTDGSGNSVLEDIELSTIGRIEVLKGPSSSLYGAGLGGTIHLIPNKGYFDELSIKSSYTLGGFGLKKDVMQINLGDLKNAANIVYNRLHKEGYRDNNKTDKQSLTLATNHFLNDTNKLTFVGNYTDLKAFIPSSINLTDYLSNPSVAAFTWGRAKGYEDYNKGLFGLSWQHNYSLKTKQYTSVFASFLDSYEPRPFNILEEQTRGVGLRSRLISNTIILKRQLEWTLGGEIFKDVNSFKTYKNLYKDFQPQVGSVQGNLLSSFREKRCYYNLFFDSKYSLSKATKLTFGLNYNNTSYRLADLFLSDGVDFSGNYNFGNILSPKIGLTQQITKNTMFYSTISHGFSPPSLEETLLPDGLINNNIKPESGWNYEVGSRGGIFNNKLNYDIALYSMDVKNLLVARRTSNDEFIGVNAGKTNYKGLEITLNYRIIKIKEIKVNLSNALAYNNFKFKDFIDDGNNYSGNDLTGVPNLTLNATFSFEIPLGLYGFINYNYVGKIPLRDDNSVYSDSYKLMHTKLGYRTSDNKKLQLDIFMGVNNVFNEKYASMVLINAGSFGGNAPRYYYPGEPVNFYSGISLKYVF
ncbi:MAG: TonB-dependent receptor [Flavobacteriaceae bacterium]